MDEEGTDSCECIWGQELAMRRLLNVIRNSQSTCNDAVCFDECPRAMNGVSEELVLTAFVILALFLYLFRPRNRMRSDDSIKPSNSGNGNNGAPPSPSPASY